MDGGRSEAPMRKRPDQLVKARTGLRERSRQIPENPVQIGRGVSFWPNAVRTEAPTGGAGDAFTSLVTAPLGSPHPEPNGPRRYPA
jgi:hypothetical protein